eukprot:5184121-Prymnesium_polylepis.3
MGAMRWQGLSTRVGTHGVIGTPTGCVWTYAVYMWKRPLYSLGERSPTPRRGEVDDGQVGLRDRLAERLLAPCAQQGLLKVALPGGWRFRASFLDQARLQVRSQPRSRRAATRVTAVRVLAIVSIMAVSVSVDRLDRLRCGETAETAVIADVEKPRPCAPRCC